MKEWAKNKKKKATIIEELHKLVPEKQLIVDGEVNDARWKAFKAKYKFTSASMAAFIREAGEDFLRSKFVKGGKSCAFSEHSQRAFSIFIKEKRIVKFEGSAHFNLVAFEPVKIMGWPGPDSRMTIRLKAGDRFPFGIIDFKNIPGNEFEGTMSVPF
jgi:hypothetical protein